jgi:hypothetical protein
VAAHRALVPESLATQRQPERQVTLPDEHPPARPVTRLRLPLAKEARWTGEKLCSPGFQLLEL